MISRRGFLQVSGAVGLGSQLPHNIVKAHKNLRETLYKVTARIPVVLFYFGTKCPPLQPGMKLAGSDPEIYYVLENTRPNWFAEIQNSGTVIGGLVQVTVLETTPDFTPIRYNFEENSEEIMGMRWKLASANVNEVLTPNTRFKSVTSLYHANRLNLCLENDENNELVWVASWFDVADSNIQFRSHYVVCVKIVYPHKKFMHGEQVVLTSHIFEQPVAWTIP